MLDAVSFTWNLIKGLIDIIINAVNFIKDLILYIPNLFEIFPEEISILLISVMGLLIGIFIFRFVK